MQLPSGIQHPKRCQLKYNYMDLYQNVEGTICHGLLSRLNMTEIEEKCHLQLANLGSCVD